MRSDYRTYCKVTSYFASRSLQLGVDVELKMYYNVTIQRNPRNNADTPLGFHSPPIVELPALSLSLSVANVNSSKALVATICDSVLAGGVEGNILGTK